MQSKSFLHFLIIYSTLFASLKAFQFGVYIKNISDLIISDECESFECMVQYLEIAFTTCVLILLVLLIIGAIKVKYQYFNWC
jgi:flagellar biosynthesis protein FlhB